MTVHARGNGAVPVASLGLDEDETGCLAVLRRLIQSDMRPVERRWDMAFRVAEERWGPSLGPRLAWGLASLLEEIRKARQADFRYIDPDCIVCRQQATAHEAQVMVMLHRMRRGDTAGAREAVAEVAEGKVPADLVRRALALATALPPCGEAGRMVGQPAPLRMH